MIAFDSNGNGPVFKQGGNQTKIKEVMNTSAPICISSYIKGAGGQRPMTKGASRRQASFGHSTGGAQFTQGGGARRSTVQNSANGGANNVASSSGNILGMVSGQTMQLSRTNKEVTNSIVARSQ